MQRHTRGHGSRAGHDTRWLLPDTPHANRLGAAASHRWHCLGCAWRLGCVRSLETPNDVARSAQLRTKRDHRRNLNAVQTCWVGRPIARLLTASLQTQKHLSRTRFHSARQRRRWRRPWLRRQRGCRGWSRGRRYLKRCGEPEGADLPVEAASVALDAVHHTQQVCAHGATALIGWHQDLAWCVKAVARRVRAWQRHDNRN